MSEMHTNTNTDTDKYILNGVEVTPNEFIDIVTNFLEAQQSRLRRRDARIAELELSSVQIQYMSEDELPKPISYKVYSAMYPCSKVDFVRMFPFVMVDGDKCFLIKLPEREE